MKKIIYHIAGLNNNIFGSGDENNMGMNEMVKALYDDLQKGTPVNFHFVTTGSEHTITFDKAYSRILIFSNLNSTNTPLTVKLNDTVLNSSNAALGYEQDSSTWGLHYTVLDVEVVAGDILSVSSSGANHGYLGIAIVY